MGKVIMSGIVPQLEVPCPYDPVFANNTWAEIIEACQKNKVPETWVVGDQKTMTFLGGTEYAIDIIGKHHDTYFDGSGTAPLTFQMHDSYETAWQMNSGATNDNGWEGCAMRSTRMPFMLEAIFPSEVNGAIKEVNKLTSKGKQSSTIGTTADKLFLLSEIEVWGRIIYSKSGEGTQYEYYKAGNSPKKLQSGLEQPWWTRSPYASNNMGFVSVNWQGTTSDVGNANGSCAVAVAFCF